MMGLRVFQLKPYKLAMAYSLINIDGVQCLLEGSTGPAGLYFRNGSDAQRFTQKYQKHENALLKKLMN